MHTEFCFGNLKERCSVGDISMDIYVRITLKLIFRT
jgi:hypothetical protein